MANCALVFLIYMAATSGVVRAVRPVLKGIEALPEGGEVYLREKGLLSDLATAINRASEKLRIQEKELKRRENARACWIAGVSHDIRTPLTSVLFYLDLITAGKCTADESVLYMEKAKRQAYHMKNLMDDLFSYSYATGDRFSLKNEEYDGNELFGQLIGDLTESLEEHGFRTEVHYKIETPFTVETDVVQLKRVLNNIGTNIEKYARRDGIVSVEVRLSDGFVCLNIEKSHTGRGDRGGKLRDWRQGVGADD